jgi:excisionase family DNA binding protein
MRPSRQAPLEPTSWTLAIARIATTLQDTQERHGADAVGVFGGGGLTNEKAYTLGKFARVVLRSKNIDYNGRFCMASAAVALQKAFGIDRGLPFPVTDMGGATTDREIVRLRGGQLRATSEDTIDLVRKLAVDLDNAQIARTLNRQGRRSGLGRAFTSIAIHSLRQKNQIPGHSHRVAKDPTEGPFTAEEAAERLGVAHTTVIQWLHDGMLAGEQLTPGAPWRIVPGEDRHALASHHA